MFSIFLIIIIYSFKFTNQSDVHTYNMHDKLTIAPKLKETIFYF